MEYIVYVLNKKSILHFSIKYRYGKFKILKRHKFHLYINKKANIIISYDICLLYGAKVRYFKLHYAN